MKPYYLRFSGILFFIFILFFSCVNKKNNFISEAGKEKSDSCQQAPEISYEVYFPKSIPECSDLPLLIVIDPHANGKLSVNKFKNAADRFSCIIIASSTIKNGSQDFINTLNQLIDNARKKYSEGKIIYLAGFSGGARMALSYAQYFPVNGVIACGAMSTPEQLSAINCPVMCIVGMADFNFIEAAQYIFNPEQAPAVLNLRFTTDTHAWPDKGILTEALGTLLMHQEKNKICPPVKKLIQDFSKSQSVKFDSLIKSDHYIDAALLARNLTKIENLSFPEKLQTVEYSPEFNQALNNLRESLRFELTVRNAYYAALNNEDMEWWEQEIASINKNLEEDTNYYRKYALKRIKGFLGIMCYSLCNNYIINNDLSSIERMLAIYKLIEPDNADMYYFTALYEYKTGHPERVGKYLKQAIQSGFSDMDRMENDLPEKIVSSVFNK